MQIEVVESFLTLCDTQNMTRAGEKLYITQQCLSQQIKSMERELGVKLFLRQRTGMVPTEIGRRLYSEFRQIAESYQNIRALCGSQPRDGHSKTTAAAPGKKPEEQAP